MSDPAADSVFHMPDDPALLTAWSRVTIRHSQLDYILRMTIGTLTGVTAEVARDATERQGSGELRDRIVRLARQRLGDGAPLLQLQALMERCKQLSAIRNDLTHGIVVSDWIEEEGRLYPDQPLPTVAELDKLASDIQAITNELNAARFRGWLTAALKARPIGGRD